MKKVEALQDGIEVRILNHPWMDPQFWDRVDRLRARKAGEPNPLVDAQAFRTWIQEVRMSAQKVLEGERAKVSAPAR